MTTACESCIRARGFAGFTSMHANYLISLSVLIAGPGRTQHLAEIQRLAFDGLSEWLRAMHFVAREEDTKLSSHCG